MVLYAQTLVGQLAARRPPGLAFSARRLARDPLHIHTALRRDLTRVNYIPRKYVYFCQRCKHIAGQRFCPCPKPGPLSTRVNSLQRQIPASDIRKSGPPDSFLSVIKLLDRSNVPETLPAPWDFLLLRYCTYSCHHNRFPSTLCCAIVSYPSCLTSYRRREASSYNNCGNPLPSFLTLVFLAYPPLHIVLPDLPPLRG